MEVNVHRRAHRERRELINVVKSLSFSANSAISSVNMKLGNGYL